MYKKTSKMLQETMEINAVKGGARKKFEMVYFIIIQIGQNSQNGQNSKNSQNGQN